MRITYIFGICALLTANPGAQLFAPANKTPEVALVDRAVDAAGGEETLKKNPAFSWTGEAKSISPSKWGRMSGSAISPT